MKNTKRFGMVKTLLLAMVLTLGMTLSAFAATPDSVKPTVIQTDAQGVETVYVNATRLETGMNFETYEFQGAEGVKWTNCTRVFAAGTATATTPKVTIEMLYCNDKAGTELQNWIWVGDRFYWAENIKETATTITFDGVYFYNKTIHVVIYK